MHKPLIANFALFLAIYSAIAVSATPLASSKTKYHRMHGNIDSLDATAQTFTVKHGNDTSTFKTDSSTKFRGAGKEITFADLKVGDNVRVSYTENGPDKIAARIDVVHGKDGTGGGDGPCCDCGDRSCKPSCCKQPRKGMPHALLR